MLYVETVMCCLAWEHCKSQQLHKKASKLYAHFNKCALLDCSELTLSYTNSIYPGRVSSSLAQEINPQIKKLYAVPNSSADSG